MRAERADVFNVKEQLRIRNAILRGEQEAAARNVQAPLPVFDPWLAAERRAQEAEEARLARERAVSDAHREKQRREAEGRQLAQQLWAKARNELRDKVAEYRNAVNAAESKSNSADDAEAGQGILELAVAERRLAAAERDYAMHAQRSPM
jgi:hypothetical protein